MIYARTRAAMAQLDLSVWRVLLHSMLAGLAISIADLLLNFYLISMGYGSDTAGLLSTISRLAGGVLGIPIGLLIDRAGARRALLIGMLTYSSGWVLMLLSRSLWTLIAAQFLVGGAQILAAISVVPLLTLATTDAQRPTVFGLNASASLMVGLVGSALGGLLPGGASWLLGAGPQDAASYRLALGAVVAVGLVALLPVLRPIHPRAQPTDAAASLDDAARLTTRDLLRFTVPSLWMGLAGGAILPFQNLFFRQQFGLPDATVGLVLAGAALSAGCGGLLGGPLSARLGLRRAAGWMRLGSVPALLLMLSPALPLAIAGFLLRGLCIAASYPLNDALVMHNTPPRQRGTAMSLLSISWSLGWAGAAALSGWAQLRWGFGPVLLGSALTYMVSGLAILTLRIAGRPA